MVGTGFPMQLLRAQPDERLVALVRDGSDPAFAAIVARYRAELVRYSGRFVGPDRAEDVVQQALVNAMGGLRADDAIVALRPWLYRICRNLALNERRRRANIYEQLDEDFDGVPQPPEIAERRERLAELVRHWLALPARQRQALAAHELEGRDYAEIAAAMNTGEVAVRGLIARARARLRDACGALIPFPLLRQLAQPSGSASLVEAAAGAGGAGMLAAKAAVTVLATGAALVAGGAAVRSAVASDPAEAASGEAPAMQLGAAGASSLLAPTRPLGAPPFGWPLPSPEYAANGSDPTRGPDRSPDAAASDPPPADAAPADGTSPDATTATDTAPPPDPAPAADPPPDEAPPADSPPPDPPAPDPPPADPPPADPLLAAPLEPAPTSPQPAP
jgi:RNA polymerase sigma-70 factor (ECF subfamily)